MKLAILLSLCILAGTAGAAFSQGLHWRPAALLRALTMPFRRSHAGPREVVWQIPTAQKVVALTFDDGPDPKYTPGVLRIAREEGVKVTFFLVGREIHLYPQLAREEVAEGHAVGNHTWDHHTMTELSRRQQMSEISRCQNELEQVCGRRPHLLRPPKGRWDEFTYRAASTLGYPVVLWSVELEHHPYKTPQQLAQRAIGLARPGAIILAHDGEASFPTDHSKTLQALPLLIDGLRQKGYRFVTVPELLAMNGGKRRAVRIAQAPGAG